MEALTIYCDKSDICDTHLERVETLLRDAEVGRLAQMERLRWRTPVCPWGNCFIIPCQDRGSLCDPFVRVFPCLWLQQSLCTASALGSRPPPPLEQPDQVLQDDGASQEHQVAGNWDRAKRGHLPVDRSCRGGNDFKKPCTCGSEARKPTDNHQSDKIPAKVPGRTVSL